MFRGYASLIALATLCGCSTWSEMKLPDLPLSRMPRDSVVLETAFVRVRPDVDLSQTWRDVDEQHLTVAVRQDLAANGLRSGITGLQLPAQLRQLLDEAAATRSGAEAFASGSVTALQQQLQSRSGERSLLVVVPKLAKKSVVLLNENGRVRAETFNGGQALLAIQTDPLGDGTVDIELTPEIKHGEAKHQWVPGDGSFMHDFSQAEFVFEKLRLSTKLSPGQTLIITCTPEPKGLGALLFAQDRERDAE